jgi:hypothetical protein
MCTHVDRSACDLASGLRVRRAEEHLKGSHGNHDPPTEAHGRELALPDELVRVAFGDAKYLTGLRHRKRVWQTPRPTGDLAQDVRRDLPVRWLGPLVSTEDVRMMAGRIKSSVAVSCSPRDS